MELELLTERLTTSVDAKARWVHGLPSDTGLKWLGPQADPQPAAFGEAGLSVTVVSLPAEGGRLRRPPAGPALKW